MASPSNSLPTPPALPTLLNEYDVARITGMSIGAVRRWRYSHAGPRFIKLNSAVKYIPSELEAWINSRPSGGENPAGAQ